MYITGGSLGLLTGMRLITGLELFFWFLAMITRICFKFGGKENVNNKVSQISKPAIDAFRKDKDEDENNILESIEKQAKTTELLATQINAIKEENRAIKEELKALKDNEI